MTETNKRLLSDHRINDNSMRPQKGPGRPKKKKPQEPPDILISVDRVQI